MSPHFGESALKSFPYGVLRDSERRRDIAEGARLEEMHLDDDALGQRKLRERAIDARRFFSADRSPGNRRRIFGRIELVAVSFDAVKAATGRAAVLSSIEENAAGEFDEPTEKRPRPAIFETRHKSPSARERLLDRVVDVEFRAEEIGTRSTQKNGEWCPPIRQGFGERVGVARARESDQSAGVGDRCIHGRNYPGVPDAVRRRLDVRRRTSVKGTYESALLVQEKEISMLRSLLPVVIAGALCAQAASGFFQDDAASSRPRIVDDAAIRWFRPGQFEDAVAAAKGSGRLLLLKGISFGIDTAGADCATKGTW